MLSFKIAIVRDKIDPIGQFVLSFQIHFHAECSYSQILRKHFTSDGCLRCGNDKTNFSEGIYQI